MIFVFHINCIPVSLYPRRKLIHCIQKAICPIVCCLLLILSACKSANVGEAYNLEQIKIVPLSSKSFIHISYLYAPGYGKVACNGLVYVNDRKAVVMDTPPNIPSTQELIRWITKDLGAEISAVVINHFHNDCLGGLKAFHELDVPSYANEATIKLAAEGSEVVPIHGFSGTLELQVGDKTIINVHPGEAHSKDNIVSYIPEEKLLFGGCMVKSLNAQKGNLADANTEQWSRTIEAIKRKFPEIEIVVPGHGKAGGTELLDYTYQLFSLD
ncbi:subclass B1 metallo-beta-lactamase [Poritiphilus flavus]|uniref:beta-lactamase n=1 Tax=Poritiphilus flavus TaxID=2697053 RepID=A0A6L9EH79_9FLAO|nr:subclass B1 metallo-beta-lactamase [Poritiphilus flavus]NAS14013.1 subclass B1 metallo-beta-lactamase [Poritiphilus flavus]